jgi:hypothetical protein
MALAWIRRREPAAIVRFGEGEGRLLKADPNDPESVQVAANKLRRQTGAAYSVDDVLKVQACVLNAFDRADVLGIRGRASFSAEHTMWVERIRAELEARLANGRAPAFVSDSVLNNRLRDVLGSLLREQRQVSVVSCRDLEPVLHDRFQIEDVRTYQVPSQFITRRVDGPYEASLHDVPIWPEFYRSHHDELSVRTEGEKFLVGAGIFGKELCIRIRDLGGIALDMGSCLDGLAGKVTRGRHKPPPYRRRPVQARREGVGSRLKSASRRLRGRALSFLPRLGREGRR